LKLLENEFVILVIWFTALGFSNSVYSHHSFATHYDSKNVVEISGTLTEVTLRNPHSFLSLDVVDKEGNVVSWEVETHAVPLLNRLGMNKNILRVGDPITIWGPRSRRPELNLLFGAQYLTHSGQEFEILKSVRRPTAIKTIDSRGLSGLARLSGKWLTHIKGQVVTDTPLNLNEAGKEARLAFDPTNTSAMRCIPPNLPALLFLPYTYEITVKGNDVTLFQEYQKIKRSVQIDSIVPDDKMPDYGSRTARFIDDTLIIESTGFTLNAAGLASGWEPNGNGYDIPSSLQKKFSESYSVNDDGSQLILNYTISDPEYLNEPYSSQIVWDRIPDETPINEITCDIDIAKRSTQNAVKESR
jgi:hypothetical protein